MSLSPAGSNGSRGAGNIKGPPAKDSRPSPAKNWSFTWNNYPDDWEEVLVPRFQEKCVGYVIGREVAPTTGTRHLQGFIEFKTKSRPFSLDLPKQITWIATKKGTPEEIRSRNVMYCLKEDPEGPKWGTCNVVVAEPYKVEIELTEWQLRIKSVLEEKPDDRSIRWFWEPDGCKGKTTFQKWVFQNFAGVVVLCGKASDMKNGVLSYLEKNNDVHPKIVLINIPRCQDTDHVSWQGIEEIKDMFFYAPKYEGGMVCGPNPHVLIFSNQEPPTWKMSSDRWIIEKL